ncbi:MAG: hypothetical protein FWE22_04190 [Firmicutes bacterium]|nr:hypothetical protein [Bacillota bacterium]
MVHITTFFSYKGGAGRSSTCLNTLPYLATELNASKNAPILLIDMDWKSAGMTYLLDQEKTFRSKDRDDIIRYIKSQNTYSPKIDGSIFDHPIFKMFVPVGKKLGLKDDDAVMFLGVDDQEKISQEEAKTGGYAKIDAIRRFCANSERNAQKIKAMVIDSSAGDQESAEISTRAATDLVTCFRATTQFRKGTFSYLERLQSENLDQDKRIFLLPTVIPPNVEIDKVSQLESTVKNIRALLDIYKFQTVREDFIDEKCFGINEVTRFKWQEGVLFEIAQKQSLAKDEEEAVKRYSKLAKLLSEDDEEDDDDE